MNSSKKISKALKLQLPQVDVLVGPKLCPYRCFYQWSCCPQKAHTQVLDLSYLPYNLMLGLFFLALRPDLPFKYTTILTTLLPHSLC